MVGAGHRRRRRRGHHWSHPIEFADFLNQAGDNAEWTALVAALRRVLAGDRDREQLLDGLDDVDTAILTATLDRLPDPGQDQ